jgi:tRNA A-37 threonylcarbamoyl transferase component Bud32
VSAEPLARQAPFGGRYLLSRKLATGGMAEIYLARQLSGAGVSDGFDKDVVIKRLKPELSRDRRILDMFMDEARIGALLNHPNIVHVYDVGSDDGVPFIAMELIAGEELNVLCRRGLDAGAFLPLGHAVQLIRQAAIAMGYFHARRGADGRPLDVVHCDISPTNLLVTEDGFLKVIDFGTARARGGRHRDEHALPGKLSYMSPEQAARRPLDARSDIFSLGVVLYEITLGRRLFKGPAQEVFQRLARCEIRPPTFIKRDFPGHLESIIMRALEREPADRYASAYDFADALEDYLAGAKLRSGPVRIARYLDELAVAAGGARRPELVPEAESERDEQLDFDRGMFEGFTAAAAVPAADWDEFDEDTQAVADALGVDVSLVRTAGKRQGTAAEAEAEAEKESGTGTGTGTGSGSEGERGSGTGTGTGTGTGSAGEGKPVAVAEPSGARATIFAIGLAAGVAVGVLLGFLLG